MVRAHVHATRMRTLKRTSSHNCRSVPHKQTLASTIISGQPHICITNAHAKVKAPTNTVTAPGPPAATAPDTCGSVTGDTSATGASEPLATIDADADLLLLPLLVTLMLPVALQLPERGLHVATGVFDALAVALVVRALEPVGVLVNVAIDEDDAGAVGGGVVVGD